MRLFSSSRSLHKAMAVFLFETVFSQDDLIRSFLVVVSSSPKKFHDASVESQSFFAAAIKCFVLEIIFVFDGATAGILDSSVLVKLMVGARNVKYA